MATVAPCWPRVSSSALASTRSFYSFTFPTTPSLKMVTRAFSSELLFKDLRSKPPPLGRLRAPVCAGGGDGLLPSPSALPAALFFDCDGVLVDTEKDGHRISFNETFAEKELGVTWDVDLYGELLKIGGGKERMTAYFNQTAWPENAPKDEEERKVLVASLHKRKTELFMTLIKKKLLPLRPGVKRLIDEALAKGVKVAVCSTSNEKAVSAIVSFLLGPERADKIVVFAGDVVPRKKPDPAIYLLAASTFGIEPSSCVVVEDSAIGLAAAKAAGMKCIITKSGYTAEENFLDADAVFDCIGDPPKQNFDLEFCAELLEKQLEAEVAKVVETQASLMRQLELIETHQEEVDKALQSMEKEAELIYKEEKGLLLEDDGSSMRDAMFEKAELIEREMERMTEQIKSIIQTFNSKQGGAMDSSDNMTPIDAAVHILNNQLSSLMRIDEKANEFSARIQKLVNHGTAARYLQASRFWLN